ncbi:MAG: metal-dependent hydrolase [Methyloprofundus sp.]|nr:metal-dependent hydrolase [Methyloprofundus sp.]
MANFNTHLFVAASASGIAALTASNKEFFDLLDMPWFIFLGTIGGLLPDIDSDSSKPLHILFNALATFTTILVILAFKDQCLIQHVFIISVAAFLTVRYPVLAVFKVMTVHRGAFHSVLCAALFTLITVAINFHVFTNSSQFSWLSGLFLGFGFIVHLLLDELYGVNLAGVQLKSSFGSAFKLFSWRYKGASLAMLMMTAALYYLNPAYPYSIKHWL